MKAILAPFALSALSFCVPATAQTYTHRNLSIYPAVAWVDDFGGQPTVWLVGSNSHLGGAAANIWALMFGLLPPGTLATKMHVRAAITFDERPCALGARVAIENNDLGGWWLGVQAQPISLHAIDTTIWIEFPGMSTMDLWCGYEPIFSPPCGVPPSWGSGALYTDGPSLYCIIFTLEDYVVP